MILLTIEEITSVVLAAVRTALSERTEKVAEPQGHIKGIKGLAEYLQVSRPQAQKIKNLGIFPYWQMGRVILFDPEKVKEAMASYNQKTRKAAK